MSWDGKEDVPYIAMDLIEGCTMHELMQQGRLPLPVIKYLYQEMVRIVSRIHNKGVVHRDLKLDNFLIQELPDGSLKMTLVDFGFAGPLYGRADGFFPGSEQMGTHPYAAPEINYGQRYRGSQVDIFALGVILFQLVFCLDPFKKAVIDDPLYKPYYSSTGRFQLWDLYLRSL